MIEDNITLTGMAMGTLRQGDIITFTRAPLSRWKRFIYFIKHWKFYKEPELRQFVVTWSDVSETTKEIGPRH